MNKKFLLIGAFAFAFVIVVSMGIAGYFYKGNIFYPKEGDEKLLMFDNSKPGKWVVSTSDSSLDGSLKLNESKKEICLTEKMINEAKMKPIKDKLGLSSLDCSTMATRLDKNKATFTTSCTGLSKGEAIGLSIDGEFLSLSDKGSITSIYTMGGEEEPFKFKRESIVARVGDCSN